jgi:hypothetical protein
MLADNLKVLMAKSFAEVRSLPKSAAVDCTDERGRHVQLVTWCDQVSPTMYRVLVSMHRLHGLGVSSVVDAEGFTIDDVGHVELLDKAEALALLR